MEFDPLEFQYTIEEFRVLMLEGDRLITYLDGMLDSTEFFSPILSAVATNTNWLEYIVRDFINLTQFITRQQLDMYPDNYAAFTANIVDNIQDALRELIQSIEEGRENPDNLERPDFDNGVNTGHDLVLRENILNLRGQVINFMMHTNSEFNLNFNRDYLNDDEDW